MFLIMAQIESPVNRYIDIYIDNYVRPFRDFIKGKYTVNIGGLGDFIAKGDFDVPFLLYNCKLTVLKLPFQMAKIR